MEVRKTICKTGCLTATQLKLMAMVLMVLDHVHQMWAAQGAPMWLTWLGRPVFPIFLFCMAESFHYTRNRKTFLIRLLLASWFMTIVSVVLQTLLLPNDDIVLMNNAFSSFFMVGLYMLFYDLFRDGVREKKALKIAGAVLLCLVPIFFILPNMWVYEMDLEPPLLQIAIVAASCLFPNILLVEGGVLYVVLGVAFYVLRRWRGAQIAALLALAAFMFVYSSDPSNQWLLGLAAVPIALYNGQRGRGMKYLFYIFYPAHIYLLYILATIL